MSTEHTVAQVFRAYGKEFLQKYGAQIPGYQKSALYLLGSCQTEKLGARLLECTSCQHREWRYNSCRHRACPQCEGAKNAKWLDARATDLLPTHYFHVVFTLPHLFNELILHNQKLCYSIFFEAVAKTLKIVSKQRLEADIGFFAILHTWGQSLEFHPHIHCVIPGGGVKKDGSWVKTSKARYYFVSQRVLSIVFRGIFIKLLKKNALKLKASSILEELLTKSCKKPWVVYAQPPFGSALLVLKYLSRYTRKIAIANSRIKSIQNSKVTFSFKDYKDSARQKLITLSATEFIRRFLQHVPPTGFVRIRHYGFLNSKGKILRLEKLKEVISGILPVVKNKKENNPNPCACKRCGSEAPLVVLQILKPQSLIPKQDSS